MKPDSTVTTQAVSTDRIVGKLPAPLLSPEGFTASSAVPRGGITLLTGEAGVDKIALALQLGFGIARLGDGERGPIGCFWALGGPVLYVTTDKSPAVIGARLQAVARRTTDNEAQAEATLARIHVLNLSHAPIFEKTRAAERIRWPALKPRAAGGIHSGGVRAGPGWAAMCQAIRDVAPVLVIINSAKLDQPAQAAELVQRLAAGQQAAAEGDRPAPSFLLVADSTEGAFGTHDPMAFGFADASWDSVMTLARARAKTERVLRIPHALYGASRLSIRLEAIAQELPAHSEGAPAPAVVGFAALASESWQRGAYGTVRAPQEPDPRNDNAPGLDLDRAGEEAEPEPAPRTEPHGKPPKSAPSSLDDIDGL